MLPGPTSWISGAPEPQITDFRSFRVQNHRCLGLPGLISYCPGLLGQNRRFPVHPGSTSQISGGHQPKCQMSEAPGSKRTGFPCARPQNLAFPGLPGLKSQISGAFPLCSIQQTNLKYVIDSRSHNEMLCSLSCLFRNFEMSKHVRILFFEISAGPPLWGATRLRR